MADGLRFVEEGAVIQQKRTFRSGALVLKLLCAIYCLAWRITVGQSQPGREKRGRSVLPESNHRPLSPC